MRFLELRDREVINIRDGRRVGYVFDAEIEFPEGRIKALIIPGPCRFFGLFGREPDFVIPVECVTRMGEDIILVDIQGTYPRSRRSKKTYF